MMQWMRPIDAQKVFCEQCDTLVSIGASAHCSDKFCRLRPKVEPYGRHNESAELLRKFSNAPDAVCDLVFRAAENKALLVHLLRSSGRSDRICRMRHAITFVAKDRLGANYREIGRALNRDHSTSIHSYRVGAALYVRDVEFRDMCERIAS